MSMTKLQAFFALVGLAAALNAQPVANDIQLDPDMQQRIAKYREDIKDATKREHALDAVTNIQPALTLLMPLVARQEVAKMRQTGIDYQQRRMDKMRGASAGGGATTSAVSKPGVADLFSAALENGALNRTQEGTATTFRVNSYGVYSLFHPPAGSCSITNPLCDSHSELTLRGLSASLTIDNSTGQAVVPMNTQTTGGASPTAVGVTRQGGRISGVGAHFDLLRRSIIEPKDYDTWRKAVTTATAQTAADGFSQALANTEKINPELKAFTACVSEGFAKATEQLDLEKAYKTCLLVLYDKIPASNIGVLLDLEKARGDYNKAMANALRNLLFKPQLTLEYTHDQPAAQPNQSTVRMIVDTKFWGRKSGPTANGMADDPQGSLTLNVAFSFYETIPQGVKAGKFRDAQAALQLDRKIGNVSWQNRPVISLAGYYQYQKEKSILQFDNKSQTPIVPIPLPQPASALLDTKGGIGIVQGKITIPVTGVISIPLAVSWSNRTELLKASEVRGQFGISIDLDKILGKSGAAQ